ncbi:unnamed protein product [Schistosoma curassoni]|uniref:Small nuclear ribonucleoprotein G n=5 Tax=Schistosoma TaxID=6181 RepID=A0A183KBM6_9TREM|nr:unnamed protein product [Schistosoma curassoni]
MVRSLATGYHGTASPDVAPLPCGSVLQARSLWCGPLRISPASVWTTGKYHSPHMNQSVSTTSRTSKLFTPTRNIGAFLKIKFLICFLFIVKLNANREVVGILRGFDAFMNIVVSDAYEVTKDGNQIKIDMAVVRGNSINIVEGVDRI